MARFGFVGPTYSSESSHADAQRCVNWFVEIDESGAGVSPLMLYDREGMSVFANLPGENAVLSITTLNGRTFAIGANLWEIFADGTANLLDKLSGQAGPAYIVGNNAYQLAISSGGNLYIYNTKTNQITVAATGQGPVSRVVFIDGYFACLIANSQKWQISALEDGTQWNGGDVAQVSVFPDNILGILADHREIWLFGNTRTVVYYNSGSNDFPFSPIPGGTLEQGIDAPDSPVRLDNSVFWLGGDERGHGIGWRANGYVPVRVSNHAVEKEWQSYATIADAVGYARQTNGHSCWVLWFPTADKTWVFDCATNMWHEETFFINGKHTAHRARCHCFAFGMHLVGDRASGTIYQTSNKFFTDFGNPIARMRRAPHITKELLWTDHKMMQVHVEVGNGPEIPLTGTPIGYPQLVVTDSNGTQWAIVVNDDGSLLATETDGTLKSQTLIVQDKDVPGSFYTITIDALHDVTTVPVAAPGGGWYKSLQMITVGGKQTELFVSDGVLASTAGYMCARGPQIILRWSDDGGHTWVDNRVKDLGQEGEFRKRAYWNRLGRSRDRIYELTFADPTPCRIMDAYLDANPDFQPTQRLSDMLRKGA